MTTLRIALIVPVPHIPGETEPWDVSAYRYIPLLHGLHLANRGHEVHAFFDGPFHRGPVPPMAGHAAREETRATLHVRPSVVPAWRGSLRDPHLVRAAAAVKPDIVHVHHLLAVEQVVAAVRLKCPVFAEFHGGHPSRSWVRRSLLRWASGRLAGAFFSAPEHAVTLQAERTLAASTRVVISPEAPSRFSVAQSRAEASRDPARSPHVLAVGRCEPPKAPYTTLALFRALARAFPQARFTWATPGGQDAKGVRSEIARDPHLQERVRFGPRPFEEMARLYASADVTLITSEREIGGTVLSESLSQGTPVAAFDLPTFRALAGGCDAVRLVSPRSPEVLTHTVGAWLQSADHPALRRTARAHFERDLSFAAIAAHRSRIYEEAHRA